MSLVVLKAGGRVAAGTAGEVRSLLAEGFDVCVVHGAGPQISAEMERRGLEVVFVGGRRVTTAAALEVVREAFAEVNRELCAAIGSPALGLFGDDIGLPAHHVPELGLVGEPIPSAPHAIVAALAEGLVPVVAPLAVGPLNVNADDAAAALALGLGAKRLVFLTDVAGLYVDDEVVDAIDVGRAHQMLDAGLFDGGIVPKLRAAAIAAGSGITAEIGRTAVVA